MDVDEAEMERQVAEALEGLRKEVEENPLQFQGHLKLVCGAACLPCGAEDADTCVSSSLTGACAGRWM